MIRLSNPKDWVIAASSMLRRLGALERNQLGDEERATLRELLASSEYVRSQVLDDNIPKEMT